MKRENSKGFTVVEVLIVIIIIGLLAGIGWYVWSKQSNSQTNTTPVVDLPKTGAYARTTTVPADWKKYEDTKYPLNFFYPANWTVAPDTKANPSLYDYEIGLGANQQSFDAIIGVKKQTLADKVAQFKSDFLEKGTVHPKLLSEKSITIDGHSATEIRYQQMIGTETNQIPSAVERRYFINVGDVTYSLPTVYETDNNEVSAADSLILFESVKITK